MMFAAHVQKDLCQFVGLPSAEYTQGDLETCTVVLMDSTSGNSVHSNSLDPLPSPMPDAMVTILQLVFFHPQQEASTDPFCQMDKTLIKF